ncbi:MAG: hypothetical protein WC476_08785 [Phycisphaerae bacterium]|jgi:hypothetical protein
MDKLEKQRTLERMKKYSEYIKGYIHKTLSNHPALIVNADLLAYEINKLISTERIEGDRI